MIQSGWSEQWYSLATTATLLGVAAGAFTGITIVALLPHETPPIHIASSHAVLIPTPQRPQLPQPIAPFPDEAKLAPLQALPLSNKAEQAEATEVQYLTYDAPASFHGTVVHQADLVTGEKVIALTLDDGPWAGSTEAILDILAQYDARATFFWVAQAVQSFPDIALRVADEGHAIGNHSWHHTYDPQSWDDAVNEVQGADAIIQEVTGIQTYLYRPPGGILDNDMTDYALQSTYTVVLWSLDSNDYADSSPEAIADQVIASAYPGAIVLLHDGGGDRSATVQALPMILQALYEQGYRFVTVPELLQLQEEGF